MNLKLFLLFSALSVPFLTTGQGFRNGKSELGIAAGAANYHGDLAREIVLKESKPMFGILYRRNLSGYFAYRLQASYASIAGSDKNFAEYSYRNLSFKTNLFEISNKLEFNYFKYGMNVRDKRYTPYVFTGINFFFFNPKAKLENNDVSLRDLNTEGQGFDNKKNYGTFLPSIPIGVGYKQNIKDNWVIGFEVGFRKTFTDYLDDVRGEYPDYERMNNEKGLANATMSHAHTINNHPPATPGAMRGDPALKDWYIFACFTISYRFTPVPCVGDKY